jgi:hypothetical protein
MIANPADASAAAWPSNSEIITSTPIAFDRVFEHESLAVTPSRTTHTEEQLAARGEVKSLVTGANGTRVGVATIRDILSRPTDIRRPIKKEKS